MQCNLVEIGVRGYLTEENARFAARQSILLRAMYPGAMMVFTISGYDGSTTELWDDENSCWYAAYFLAELNITEPDELAIYSLTMENSWLISCAAIVQGRVIERFDNETGVAFRIRPKSAMN